MVTYAVAKAKLVVAVATWKGIILCFERKQTMNDKLDQNQSEAAWSQQNNSQPIHWVKLNMFVFCEPIGSSISQGIQIIRIEYKGSELKMTNLNFHSRGMQGDVHICSCCVIRPKLRNLMSEQNGQGGKHCHESSNIWKVYTTHDQRTNMWSGNTIACWFYCATKQAATRIRRLSVRRTVLLRHLILMNWTMVNELTVFFGLCIIPL